MVYSTSSYCHPQRLLTTQSSELYPAKGCFCIDICSYCWSLILQIIFQAPFTKMTRDIKSAYIIERARQSFNKIRHIVPGKDFYLSLRQSEFANIFICWNYFNFQSLKMSCTFTPVVWLITSLQPQSLKHKYTHLQRYLCIQYF